MKFGRRLRLYILGVLLGSVMVMFFFDDRLDSLTDWMPNNRVLYRLRVSPSSISNQAMCQLKCYKLDTAAVRIIKEEGDVDFTNSQTKSDIKVYLIDGEVSSENVQMTFEVRDSSNTLIGVNLPDKRTTCDCP